MGEGTGGGVDTDVGGVGLDTGSDRDTSPSSDLGQSPGAMGGRVNAFLWYNRQRWAVGFQVLFPM